jgi:hypothetical protein
MRVPVVGLLIPVVRERIHRPLEDDPTQRDTRVRSKGGIACVRIAEEQLRLSR